MHKTYIHAHCGVPKHQNYLLVPVRSYAYIVYMHAAHLDYRSVCTLSIKDTLFLDMTNYCIYILEGKGDKSSERNQPASTKTRKPCLETHQEELDNVGGAARLADMLRTDVSQGLPVGDDWEERAKEFGRNWVR